MPQLDVSWVAMDPMTADCFSVTRREEIVDAKGRSQLVTEVFPDEMGTITFQDPAALMRTPEGQMVPRSIFVASTFCFRGVSKDSSNPAQKYQPDIITWGGVDYTVKQVYPYSRYGAGFHEVVAESMQAVDPAI